MRLPRPAVSMSCRQRRDRNRRGNRSSSSCACCSGCVAPTYRLDVNIPEVALVTIWSDMSRPVQEPGYGSGKGAACERRAGLSLSGVLSAAQMKTRLHSPHSPSFPVERAGCGETSSPKIELPDQPTFPVHLGDRYAQVARPPPLSLAMTWACRRCQPRCKRAQHGGVDGGHALLRPAGPPGWAGLLQNTYGDHVSIATGARGTVAWTAAWTVAQRACPGQTAAG